MRFNTLANILILPFRTWTRRSLAHLEFPVGMTYADITGNGFNDGMYFTFNLS